MALETRVEIQGKAEDRRQAELDLTVGTIDLNADPAVAAAWEGVRCRGVRTIWHARENAKREKVLQKVARTQKHSGRPVQGERSHMGLGRYIAALDSAVAWQGATAIVTWAVMASLHVLVFEHLRAYRPERGVSWSRRTNRKRSYWLRGKVLEHVRHLALWHGILVVERNPAWSSAAFPHGSHLGERLSPDGRGELSRFRCVHCGWTGDANVVAAWNLKRKWDRTLRYPTQQEVAEARRTREGSAAVSRKSSPEMVRGNVRRTTDAPRAFCPCGLHGKAQAAVVGRVPVLCACAKGLLREASDDSQSPVDPTQAQGGRPFSARGTKGNRRRPDWGGANDACLDVSGKSASGRHTTSRFSKDLG